MKAMILAAGKGTRIRPLTYQVPKPMIRIFETPLIVYLIRLLCKHGFDEIMINTSHFANEIESYLGDGQNFDVEIAYSFEGQVVDNILQANPLGTAGGIKKIQDSTPFFDDTFIVLCGDGLIDLNLTEAINFHRKKGALATVITKSIPLKNVVNHGVVVTDGEDRVKSFQVKPKANQALSNIVDTGIYIFEPEILDLIPSGVEYDITGELFQKILSMNLPFYGINMDFQWLDIGNTVNYQQAISKILRGEVQGINIPGRKIRPEIYVGLGVQINFDKTDIQGPVYIGGRTCIGEYVRIIGPSMIGRNCKIMDGVTIDNCIISEYSLIGSEAILKNKLMFGKYIVDKTGSTFNLQNAGLNWLIGDSRQFELVDPPFLDAN